MLTGHATRWRHPALGRHWIDHDGGRWPVRRAWPAGEDVVALELDIDGAAVGATVDGDGAVRLIEIDEELPSLAAWRARAGATVIAHRPGKRAVVDVAGAGGRRRYVKIATPRAAARALERTATVAELLAGVTDAPSMAPVLGHDRAAGEVAFGPLPGRSLGRVVAADVIGPARCAGAAAGRALAALAACAADGLPAHTATDEVAVVDRWVDDAVRYGAVAGTAADRLRQRRDQAVAELRRVDAAEGGHIVLAHRDVHDGQLLVGDDRRRRVGLLDWDTACASSPAGDAGNLLAHLDRLAATHPATAGAAICGLAIGARAAGHDAWSPGAEELAAWRAVAAVRLDAVHAFRPAITPAGGSPYP